VFVGFKVAVGSGVLLGLGVLAGGSGMLVGSVSVWPVMAAVGAPWCRQTNWLLHRVIKTGSAALRSTSLKISLAPTYFVFKYWLHCGVR
jgi:hypothetical protein